MKQGEVALRPTERQSKRKMKQGEATTYALNARIIYPHASLTLASFPASPYKKRKAKAKKAETGLLDSLWGMLYIEKYAFVRDLYFYLRVSV